MNVNKMPGDLQVRKEEFFFNCKELEPMGVEIRGTSRFKAAAVLQKGPIIFGT